MSAYRLSQQVPGATLAGCASDYRLTSTVARVAAAFLAAAALSACERAQVADPGKRKPDTPAWQGTDNKFADANWKRGDAASWEEQLRKRSQGQDEYSRASSPSK